MSQTTRPITHCQLLQKEEEFFPHKQCMTLRIYLPIRALRLKVEILLFEGINPTVWVRWCSKYFLVRGTLDELKIKVAYHFLGEVADVWYQGWLTKKKKTLKREVFVKEQKIDSKSQDILRNRKFS